MQDQNNYQQNTPQPDYGFIQDYDQPVPGPKKKIRIFIAFGILLVALVGIGALAVLTQGKPSNNSTSQSQVVAKSENAYVSDPVIALLRDKDEQGLYELTTREEMRSVITPDVFQKNTYNILIDRANYSECTQLSDTTTTRSLAKEQFPAVQLRCKGIGDYGDQRILVAYTKENNTLKYISIVISDYNEENL